MSSPVLFWLEPGSPVLGINQEIHLQYLCYAFHLKKTDVTIVSPPDFVRFSLRLLRRQLYPWFLAAEHVLPGLFAQ